MNTSDLRSRLRLTAGIKILGAALLFLGGGALLANANPSNSIARVWNERALAAIRVDTPHPPAQARNLFSFSVCMYDAWAAYDPLAVGYVYRAKHTAADVSAARSNAISYAVYRMMKERHVYSRTAGTTLPADDALMTALGFDPNNNSRDTSTPIGVGNSVYDAVSAWFINDGARQTNGIPYPLANPPIAYPDYTDSRAYVYVNLALATDKPGIDDGYGNGIRDINRWQRLQVVNARDQGGFSADPLQKYLGAQWLGVRSFAMTRTDPTKPWIDPGPPPYFGGASHVDFRSNIVEVIRYGSQLTPNDGVIVDISPASQGNNSLGANDGHGRALNPVTGLPYTPNLAKRGDFARALTEFWADGPTSETPPGHWNVIANDVADHPLTVKKIAGAGPVVDDLEWDVKTYFALNAALHEAACAAWSVKRYYDGYRPMSAIRHMGGLGQSSEPDSPSYDPNGLPLITNLIELVTASSVASGRHAGLTPGKIATLSWPGEPSQRVAPQGVRFIHADTWMPYQRSNFVTPAFPGYISGHSTFTRSAAELLTEFTGTPFFPGGMASYTITSLLNEKGPSQPVTLQWATYFDAGDQVGISRIWGGIHPPVDDFAGRRVGAQCGSNVWALAQKYFDGSVINPPIIIVCSSNVTLECTGGLSPVNYSVSAVDSSSNPVPVVCAPPSGSGFRLGTSNVTCTATDSGGHSNTCSFTVTVVDTTPPLVACNANITTDATSASGAVVTYTSGASDACGLASFDCAPPSGSAFVTGTTTVTCRASDGTGNSNTCSFTVTVILVPPPVLTCSNLVAECTGGLTPVNYSVSAVDSSSNPVPVLCAPPSGSAFRLGTSNVTCTATDSGGRSGTCSFTVTVVDTTPPRVTCNTNITTDATSASGAVVRYVSSASDPCGIASFDCAPPSASTFLIGTTTVTCRATDGTGNSNGCSFTVTVILIPPPVLTCSNLVAECTGGLTPINYNVSAVDSLGNPVSVVCAPPSGSGFRLGTSNVTCTATDGGGRTGSCSFTVTVVDTSPPRVTCNTNIIIDATSASGAVVTYIASASDPCGIASFDCAPPSGSTFPAGTTPVTCRATDGTGNSNACSFTITVTSPNDPPVADASATRTSIISANNADAAAVLDASRSLDPNGDPLTFEWSEGGIRIATGAVASVTLSVGSHTITLKVSDGLDTATVTILVSVLTAGEAVEQILTQVDQADIGSKNKRPFIATLKTVVASFDRGDSNAALNQLNAFIEKVRAQLGRTNPALADRLIMAAQAVIVTLQGP